MRGLQQRGTPRRRAWLTALAILLTCGLLWTTWAYYVKSHTVTRYVQQSPGAAAAVGGETYEVLSMVITDTLRPSGSGDPAIAPAGATYVVVRFKVTTAVATEYPACSLPLVGRDGRTWQSTRPDVYRTEVESSCSDSEAGVPQLVEAIYEINTADADTLFGLAVDDGTSADPVPVIRPK